MSSAFAAAQRWEWPDRNPAESAKPPTTIGQRVPATSPDDAAKVIAEARAQSAALGMYLWLVVVTGVRRGELCGLQIRDIGLSGGPREPGAAAHGIGGAGVPAQGGVPGGVCDLPDGPAHQDDLWPPDVAVRRIDGVVRPGKHKASPIIGGLI